MDWKQEADNQFAMFRERVIAHLEPIQKLGYELEETDQALIVSIGKPLSADIHCRISYQLIGNTFSPVSQFNIWLYRRSSPSYQDGEPYAPIAITLGGLLRGYYKRELKPTSQMFWEYSNQNILDGELVELNQVLVEVGISWLEDSASNIKRIQEDTSFHRNS
jgi:hypothetical protein